MRGLKACVSGVKSVPYFDTSNYRTHQGAIITGFNKDRYVMADGTIEKEPGNVLGLWAAKEAVLDAKLQMDTVDKKRVGVSIATSLGSIASKDQFNNAFLKSGYGTADPLLMFETCSTTAGVIAKEYGCQGCAISISTACAAGTNSIGYALDLIRKGECDVVIAGGSDPFSRLSLSGFDSLQSTTKKNIAPFDQNRDGIIIGEAAAIMVIEELDFAKARNVPIYGEVLGYGISNDAYHTTSPDPKGGGAIRAITQALEDAGLAPEEIDYINAHGTGTILNDVMELGAISQVFGDWARKIPISSTKSLYGHNLACAGSIEAVTCVLAIHDSFIPATINTKEIMEGYKDFNLVLGQIRKAEINTALSTSFAFAGNTAAAIISKYKE